ncbi:DUF4132 domain-containing protein [Spirillospora sp. NPDC029432]|uniref:DUF4132 domain-containing protein n=1 Tax=Spirillospora sp. NPDC029432 TaxID=3154599 RepID=UPI003452B0CA
MEDRLSGEDALILPDALRRHVYPRRDGSPGPKPKVNRAASGTVRERLHALGTVRPLAEHEGVTPDMAEALRAYLSGSAHPFGAAVAAALLLQGAGNDDEKVAVLAVDSWVAEHGLPFAACAFAECSQILWGCPGLGLVDGSGTAVQGSAIVSQAPKAAVRLRAFLASADEEVYREAVDRLAGCRRTASQRVAVSFLVPTREDWVDECCADPPPRRGQLGFWWMLYGSLGSPRQVDRLLPYEVVSRFLWDRALLASMADAVGPGVTPLVVASLDDTWDTFSRKLFLEVLAVLPGDEAFRALVERSGQKNVQPALLAAAKRFPERARRLLPELAAERDALAAGRLPDAPPDVLPEALTVPQNVPARGEWADLEILPQIRLRDRNDALPAVAARRLLTMLATSSPGDLAAVKDACDAESLASFGWALFRLWEKIGAPSKDRWALSRLGWSGDDGTVRLLAPLIRAWPAQRTPGKAFAGLDALAGIGSDAALTQLDDIAQRAKYKDLRKRAGERFAEVAGARGLTPEELRDRLVPDFGLDATGALVLDYGPRRFLAGFDAGLRPYVTTEDGTPRRSLPKPGAKDDPDLAPAAYQRFTMLKKEVGTVVGDQIRRLEAAMVARRRWTVPEFRRLFVDHPLLWHVARRLVWLAEDPSGTTPFRVAEDRTFAGLADDALTLRDAHRVGLAHPLDLDGTLGAWRRVLADYELMQPFPQLERPVHVLTEAERGARRLTRLQDAAAPARAVLALEQRGWRRGRPTAGGYQRCLYRETPGGLFVNIRLDPGMKIGHGADNPEQRLAEIRLDDTPEDGDWSPRDGRPFGDLAPPTASEILDELTEATTPK